MPTFFTSLTELDRWSHQLDAQAIVCQHCERSGHLVGHGFVYRKALHGLTDTVGKRIRCSKRYGRTGCGRTSRLYLDQRVPGLQYSAETVHAFLIALLAGSSVAAAYRQATKALCARHAWRWMNRLQRRLPEWRSRLANVVSNARFGPFAVLLPTLAAWLHGHNVAHAQSARQMAFF